MDIPKITAEETKYGVAMYARRGYGKARVNHKGCPCSLEVVTTGMALEKLRSKGVSKNG
jgi:hypothetical protein